MPFVKSLQFNSFLPFAQKSWLWNIKLPVKMLEDTVLKKRVSSLNSSYLGLVQIWGQNHRRIVNLILLFQSNILFGLCLTQSLGLFS